MSLATFSEYFSRSTILSKSSPPVTLQRIKNEKRVQHTVPEPFESRGHLHKRRIT